MLRSSVPTWPLTRPKSTCSSINTSANTPDVGRCVWKPTCVLTLPSNPTRRAQPLLQVGQPTSTSSVQYQMKKNIWRTCVLIYPPLLSGYPAGIRFRLTVDPPRAKARASFLDPGNKSSRNITRVFSSKDQQVTCIQETFMMSVSALIFEKISWEFSHGVLP